jgi:hypothetical protein
VVLAQDDEGDMPSSFSDVCCIQWIHSFVVESKENDDAKDEAAQKSAFPTWL